MNPLKNFGGTSLKKNKSVSELHTNEGTIRDELQISEAFNRYFTGVFTKDDGLQTELSTVKEFLVVDNLVLSERGLLSLLLNLKTTTSIGPDGIPNLFLKRYVEWVAK